MDADASAPDSIVLPGITLPKLRPERLCHWAVRRPRRARLPVLQRPDRRAWSPILRSPSRARLRPTWRHDVAHGGRSGSGRH